MIGSKDGLPASSQSPENLLCTLDVASNARLLQPDRDGVFMIGRKTEEGGRSSTS